MEVYGEKDVMEAEYAEQEGHSVSEISSRKSMKDMEVGSGMLNV